MLLQTFDAEEFLADGVFGIPRGSGWTSSEGAKDRRYQVGLSAPGTRILSRAHRLANPRCRNRGAGAASVTLRGIGSDSEATDLTTKGWPISPVERQWVALSEN